LDGKREIMLGHLSPGNYELQLSVCWEGQEKDASQLCMAVTVSSVWWQTRWFAVIVVLVVLMTLYGLRIRLKRKRSSEDKVTESTVDPFLQQVMDIIEQNYKNPEFSVENLAKELGTSKSTLIRRLKPLTDFTPVELIGVYRLKKADDMLRTTNAPVKEVAFMTGFSSQYYFSRKYKEYFGYPPSQNKERE
jgi:transcriptional regulator GlxA family with amidase domain